MAEWQDSVDLIMEDDTVLIRPDPDNMQLMFRADELLQELVPKHQVKFLLVRNEKVRTAIKQRGEYWRISPLPKTPDEMKQMIAASKIGHPRRRDVLLQQGDGHAIPDVRGLRPTGRLGRAGPAAAPGGNSRSFRPESIATAARKSPSSWRARASRRPISPPFEFAALDGPALRARVRSTAGEVLRRGAAASFATTISTIWSGATGCTPP